ncbi:hypothetical protein JT358_05530 [Micrococcales bacterium 31B]|nr:hypothetical protein [Micrococcales bacterium 31B]
MLVSIGLDEYLACRAGGSTRLPTLDLEAPPTTLTVAAVLGSGFDAYLRVLHPFSLAPIRWHARSSSTATIGASTRATALRDADDESLPYTGVLDVATSRVLCRLLFADPEDRDVIVGFDARHGLHLERMQPLRREPEVHSHVGWGVHLLRDTVHMVPYFASRSPLFMWPLSGAWHFAAEVDGYSTYLGCDARLAEALRGSESLEILELHPDEPYLDPRA